MSSKETAGSTDCLSINEVGGHRQREMAPCIILLLLFPGGLHAFHLGGGGGTLHRAIFCIFGRREFLRVLFHTRPIFGGRSPSPPHAPLCSPPDWFPTFLNELFPFWIGNRNFHAPSDKQTTSHMSIYCPVILNSSCF